MATLQSQLKNGAALPPVNAPGYVDAVNAAAHAGTPSRKKGDKLPVPPRKGTSDREALLPPLKAPRPKGGKGPKGQVAPTIVPPPKQALSGVTGGSNIAKAVPPSKVDLQIANDKLRKATTDATGDRATFLASVLNEYAEGGPCASPANLKFAVPAYVVECVQRAVRSGRLSPEGTKIANEVLADVPSLGDDLDIPANLRVENRVPLTPEQQAKVDAQMKAAKAVDPATKGDQLRQQQAAKSVEKSRVRIEKLKASQNGAAQQMPLTGKAALRAIADKAVATNGVTKIAAGVTAAKKTTTTGKTDKKADKFMTKPWPTAKSPKRKTSDRAKYDWSGAREKAAKGTIPATPDFSANTHRSYRKFLDEVEALVKAKDLKGLQAYRVKGSSTSPNAIKKYREIAIIALKAKKS